MILVMAKRSIPLFEVCIQNTKAILGICGHDFGNSSEAPTGAGPIIL